MCPIPRPSTAQVWHSLARPARGPALAKPSLAPPKPDTNKPRSYIQILSVFVWSKIDSQPLHSLTLRLRKLEELHDPT